MEISKYVPNSQIPIYSCKFERQMFSIRHNLLNPKPVLNLKVRCDFFHAFFCTYLQGFELGLSDQRKNIAVVCHWLALGWLLYLQLNKRLLLPRVTLWCNWQTVLQIWTIIWTNEDHIASFMLLYITIYPFVTKLWKRDMIWDMKSLYSPLMEFNSRLHLKSELDFDICKLLTQRHICKNVHHELSLFSW